MNVWWHVPVTLLHQPMMKCIINKAEYKDCWAYLLCVEHNYPPGVFCSETLNFMILSTRVSMCKNVLDNDCRTVELIYYVWSIIPHLVFSAVRCSISWYFVWESACDLYMITSQVRENGKVCTIVQCIYFCKTDCNLWLQWHSISILSHS